MNKHLITLGIAVLLICVGLSGCETIEYTFYSDKLEEEPEEYIEISEQQMEQFPHLKEAIQSDTYAHAPKVEFDEVRKLLEDIRNIKYSDKFYEISFSTNSKYF